MNEYGVQRSAAVYAVLLKSYAAEHNLEPALRTYFQMKRENIALELSAAQTLVSVLAHVGYSRLAYEVAMNYEQESARSIPDHVWSEILACAAKNLDVRPPSPIFGVSSILSLVRHHQEGLGSRLS